jgi:hypothetical protein
MAVAGASRYLNSSMLANTRGISAQSTNLIGSLGTVSLLDVGRSGQRDFGIGLSSQSRLLNRQFLESSASTFNSIFSLNVAGTSSIESLQQQINALRASLPESSLSREVRGMLVDEDA